MRSIMEHKNNIKYWFGSILIVSTIMGIFILNLLIPDHTYSKSERRELEQAPTLSLNSFFQSEVSDAFESYSMDQIVFREGFRRIKSMVHYYVMQQKDNHGIYIADGYASQILYPLDETSIQTAVEHFQSIYDTYLWDKEVSIYASVVPDKNYFLADENDYLSIDYEAMFQKFEEGMEYATYIPLTDCLSVSDYYKTDTHWKQTELLSVAEKIASSMNINLAEESSYQRMDTKVPFYGVYYGQSALPLKSDEISYLTNETLDACKVYNYETNEESKVYHLEKLDSDDPYEMFLSGAAPLLEIENPKGILGKELIVFRDSFGSSLVPLLLSDYAKITLVDTRYISSSYLGAYIEFDHQDILFLYSTLVLNNSYSLK